jgi:hypothetical protein
MSPGTAEEIAMADPRPASKEHEIFVFDGEQLLQELKKAGSTTREDAHEVAEKGLEANEWLKSTVLADVVAISQLMQSAQKSYTQIKLLGVLGNAYMKESKGKKYIIFKGRPGSRPNLKGTRYLAENPKVRCFVVGSKDILEDAAKSTKVAIIAFVAIDIIAEINSDHPSMVGLGVSITSDALQAVAAAYIGAAAGIIATTLGAPVVITFIAVVAVGFVAGMGLTYLDRRFHLTELARARMIGLEQELEKDVTLARQRLVAASTHAYDVSRKYVRQEAIRVDKYYHDAKAMIVDNMSRDSSYIEHVLEFMP